MQSRRPSFMQRLRAPEAAPGWTLATGAIFVGAYVLFWIVILSSVSILTDEMRALPTPQTLALSGAISAVVLVLGVAQWARVRGGAGWVASLRLTEPRQAIALLALLIFGLGMAWAIDLLGVLLQQKQGLVVPATLAGLMQGSAMLWLLTAFVALVAQPLAEGLIFYGVLYPALAFATRDNRIAIIGTALVFLVASIVLAGAPNQWYVAIQPFLMALVIGSVRAYTKSTRAAIVTRVGFGLFFVLAALFSGGFAP